MAGMVNFNYVILMRLSTEIGKTFMERMNSIVLNQDGAIRTFVHKS